MEYGKPWIKNIKLETLPNEDLKIAAAVIGLDATIKLMCELAGISISIPKNATLKAKTLDFEKKEVIMQKKSCTDPKDDSVLETIGSSGIEQDDLIRHLNISASDMLVKITELELNGFVTRKNGSFLVLTKQGLEKLK